MRSITGGDETVPTVVVDGTALVNPSASAVRDLVGGAVSVPGDRADPAGRSRGLVATWVLVAVVVAASFVVDGFGFHALSWGLDGVAVVVYAGSRFLRHRGGLG